MPNHDLAKWQQDREDAAHESTGEYDWAAHYKTQADALEAHLAATTNENIKLRSEIHEWEESDKAGPVLTGLIDEAQRENARLRLALDSGKHIVADMLHGVFYAEDQLHAWISDAESALTSTPVEPQPEAISEDYWDQNSVQCGNCSVEILTRKGTIPNNNGLSDTGGSEDEALCGRCAGGQMYLYMDQLDGLATKTQQAPVEPHADTRRIDLLESYEINPEDQGCAFQWQYPTDEELRLLEDSIDDLPYCPNDVLILIREVRRLRSTEAKR